MDIPLFIKSLSESEIEELRECLSVEIIENHTYSYSDYNYQKKAEENRKKLASRTSGLIPIEEFVLNFPMSNNLKDALLTMSRDGIAYYMDDITHNDFLKFRYCGKKSWETLLSLIESLQNIPQYKEYHKALQKHFIEQNEKP